MLVCLLCVSILAVLLHFLLLSLGCYSGISTTIPMYIIYVCSFDYTWVLVLAEFDSHSFFPVQLILQLDDLILNSIFF